MGALWACPVDRRGSYRGLGGCGGGCGVADLDILRANGERPTAEGSTVTLRKSALDLLAEHCTTEDDGHYDGTHIWMGGSEYEVSPA